VAHALADAARPVAMRYFRLPDQGLENKDARGFDPVTAADRGIEEAMRQILAAARPDDAVLGEEFGRQTGSTGLTWVLDPIDGTRGFISGTPTWGVLIAVGPETGPTIGMIDQPFIRERFWGWPDGAYRNHGGQTCGIRVRPCATLGLATLFTTFPEVGTLAEKAAFQRVAAAARLVRYGMDCYAYALLASGQVDLVIEAGMAPYDIHGPLALVKAAGGIVTNWQGGPAHQGGQVIAAGDPRIHAESLRLLAGGQGLNPVVDIKLPD